MALVCMLALTVLDDAVSGSASDKTWLTFGCIGTCMCIASCDAIAVLVQCESVIGLICSTQVNLTRALSPTQCPDKAA